MLLGNKAVEFRSAGCNQVFEQTLPSYPLPQSGEARHYSGRETLPQKLG